MFKRRIAALVAVGAVLFAGGLAGSANASSDEPPAKGTCVTSDGKTFEFTEAVRAVRIEPGKGGEAHLSADDQSAAATEPAATIRVDAQSTDGKPLPEGAVAVERWSEATETTEAVPATPAPGVEAGEIKAGQIKVGEIKDDVSIAATATATATAPDGDATKAITITCTAK
ncbi:MULTISPECIES: hypothetical protein [Nonomuraea]|uniref:Uncharacterized protein n=1 Tax=Nonomuraea mangrovi TaxID=2316207 RepID=A0ABW4SUQ0_9ACTN